MGNFSRKRKYIPLAVILLVLLGVGGVFFFRSPVLVVTDNSFNQLYGVFRSSLKGIKLSLELFRRVIPVTVAENAGADLISLAADAAYRSPMAVIFPFRYIDGARYYKQAHQSIPVLLMAERNLTIPAAQAGTNRGSPDSTLAGQLQFVYTDTDQDLYRAGLCAALFAGEGKGILFFTDDTLSSEYRNAFQEGLKAQGFQGNPVYLNSSSDYSSYNTIGCVVLAGSASKFLDRNLKIPIILFSWLDPTLTPRTVKLVFDDSPLALALEALKPLAQPDSAAAGKGIYISSDPVLLRSNIGDKNDFRKLSELIKENSQKK